VKKFWLIQFIANALIVFAFYEWLGIRDSRASQLIISLVLGLAIAAGTVFLHSRTFNMKPGRFAVILLIFLLVCWGLNAIPIDRAGVWLASVLTYNLRKPVKPAFMVSVLTLLKDFVQWIVVPLLLLHRHHSLFWLQYIGVVLAGFFIPSLLIHWTPTLTATWLQVTSFALRFLVAYCLVTTGFAALWRLTSSGSPAPSQPKTVALP